MSITKFWGLNQASSPHFPGIELISGALFRTFGFCKPQAVGVPSGVPKPEALVPKTGKNQRRMLKTVDKDSLFNTTPNSFLGFAGMVVDLRTGTSITQLHNYEITQLPNLLAN